MAVGDIAAGDVSGEGLPIMYLNTRRSVFRPCRVLGFGFVGVRGGLGGLLGGVPIANPSGDFRRFHRYGYCPFGGEFLHFGLF